MIFLANRKHFGGIGNRAARSHYFQLFEEQVEPPGTTIVYQPFVITTGVQHA